MSENDFEWFREHGSKRAGTVFPDSDLRVLDFQEADLWPAWTYLVSTSE